MKKQKYSARLYTGPNGVPVGSMTREELEQELCAMYDLGNGIVEADSLRTIASAIDAMKEFLEG